MYLKTYKELQKTSVFFIMQPPRTIYAIIFAICISFILLFFWAAFSPMDEVVKGDVILRPSETVSSVKCVSSGQIVLKNYNDGTIVHKGDLLFSLDTSVYKLELEYNKNELIRYQNEQKNNIVFLTYLEKGNLNSNNIENIDNPKLVNYLSELQRYEAVINDFKNKLEREEQKPNSLKIPINIEDLKYQISENTYILESWKATQKLQAYEEKKQIEISLNSINGKINELERNIKNATIISPISGCISEVQNINVGDYIMAGEEILKIVPQSDEKIKADIYIDPSYIALIKKGDSIKIKFQGLPPSKYGIIETSISVVSPDISYINGTGVFIIEADIVYPFLTTKKGQKKKLVPGITGEGLIIIDKTTVLQMLFKKLDFIN